MNNISGLKPELSRRKGRFEVYFCQTAYPWPLVARVHSLPEEHQETSPSLIHIFLSTTAAYKIDFSSKTRTPWPYVNILSPHIANLSNEYKKNRSGFKADWEHQVENSVLNREIEVIKFQFGRKYLCEIG